MPVVNWTDTVDDRRWPQPAATVNGVKLYTPRTAASIFTPRTASRRTIGPIKVSQKGIWERLDNGTGRVTPRPKGFNTTEVKLSEEALLEVNEDTGTADVYKQQRRMSTLHEMDENLSRESSLYREASRDPDAEQHSPLSQRSAGLQLTSTGTPLVHYGSDESQADDTDEIPNEQTLSAGQSESRKNRRSSLLRRTQERVKTREPFDRWKEREEGSHRLTGVPRDSAALSWASEMLPPIALECIETPCRTDENDDMVPEISTPDSAPRTPVSVLRQKRDSGRRQTLPTAASRLLKRASPKRRRRTTMGAKADVSPQSATLSAKSQATEACFGLKESVSLEKDGNQKDGNHGLDDDDDVVVVADDEPSEGRAALPPPPQRLVERMNAAVSMNRALHIDPTGYPSLDPHVTEEAQNHVGNTSSINDFSSPCFGRVSTDHHVSDEVTQSAVDGDKKRDMASAPQQRQTLPPTTPHSRYSTRSASHRDRRRRQTEASATTGRQKSATQEIDINHVESDGDHEKVPSHRKSSRSTSEKPEDPTKAVQSLDSRLSSLWELYERFGIHKDVMVEQHQKLLKRLSRGDSLSSNEHSQMMGLMMMMFRASELNGVSDTSLTNVPSLDQDASLQRSSARSVQPEASVERTASIVDVSPNQHDRGSDDHCGVVIVRPAFPDLGLQWNEFHAASSPYLNEENFVEPYPSLAELTSQAAAFVEDVTVKTHGLTDQLSSGSSFSAEALSGLLTWVHARLAVDVQDFEALQQIHYDFTHKVTDLEQCDPKPQSSSSSSRFSACLQELLFHAKIKCWTEALVQLDAEWPQRYMDVERKIQRFPTTLLARRQLQWMIGARAGSQEDTKKLGIMMQHMAERNELLCVKALGQWKRDVTLPIKEKMVTQLRDTSAYFQSIVQSLDIELEKAKRYREQFNDDVVEKETHTQLLEAKQHIIAQLTDSVTFERRQKERALQRLEEQQRMCEQLEGTINTLKKDIEMIQQRIALSRVQLRKKQAVVRLVTLQRDALDAEQTALGYRLEKVDLDVLEIQLAARPSSLTSLLKTSSSSVRDLTSFSTKASSQYLWAHYLNKSTVSILSGPSNKRRLHENAHERTGFDEFVTWDTYRTGLMESLFETEVQDDMTWAKALRNILLPGLTIPPAPRVSIWWRYEGVLPGMDTIHLLEGLRVQLKPRLSKDFHDYVPTEFRQLYSQHESKTTAALFYEPRFMLEKPPSPQLCLLGMAPSYFDWTIRRALYDFAENRLNDSLDLLNKAEGLPYRSPIEDYLEAGDQEEIPFHLFAPVVNMERLVTAASQSILCCQRIDALMNQLRELFVRYHPTGLCGAEVTYVPAGVPLRDYRQRQCNAVPGSPHVFSRNPTIFSKEPHQNTSGVEGAQEDFTTQGEVLHAKRRTTVAAHHALRCQQERTAEGHDLDVAAPVFEDDEILITVVLLNPSLHSLHLWTPSEISITLVCNVGISLLYGSFLYGVRRSFSGVFFDEATWHLSRSEYVARRTLLRQANAAFQIRLREYRDPTRRPQAEDLVKTIAAIEETCPEFKYHPHPHPPPAKSVFVQ